jgi:hypothetical protein
MRTLSDSYQSNLASFFIHNTLVDQHNWAKLMSKLRIRQPLQIKNRYFSSKCTSIRCKTFKTSPSSSHISEVCRSKLDPERVLSYLGLFLCLCLTCFIIRHQSNRNDGNDVFSSQIYFKLCKPLRYTHILSISLSIHLFFSLVSVLYTK